MRVLGAGDNVVDRYPDLERFFPGGNALNVAVAARRSGASASYLGVLGDDDAGRTVLDALHAEGVGTDRLRIAHGPNAWADVTVQAGERVFLRSSATISPFRLDAADLAYAASFDIVHACAGGFIEDDLRAIRRVADISFDFKSHRDAAYLDPLLESVTVAFFSASDLADDETVSLLEAATRGGPAIALATRGPADALAFCRGRLWRQASVAETIVDTLGAGDAFVGRFLVGHLGGEDIETTLSAAADAAASTCASYGAFGYGRPYAPPLQTPDVPMIDRGVVEERAPG